MRHPHSFSFPLDFTSNQKHFSILDLPEQFRKTLIKLYGAILEQKLIFKYLLFSEYYYRLEIGNQFMCRTIISYALHMIRLWFAFEAKQKQTIFFGEE